jgi:hypothetical protein
LNPITGTFDVTELVRQFTAQLTADLWMLIVPIMGLLFLHIAGERIIEGLMWKIGRTYNEEDVVLFDKRFARITKIGLWNVKFTVYEVGDDDKIVGGWSLIVANDMLKRHEIMKPLELHDIPKSLKPIHK